VVNAEEVVAIDSNNTNRTSGNDGETVQKGSSEFDGKKLECYGNKKAFAVTAVAVAVPMVLSNQSSINNPRFVCSSRIQSGYTINW
jgi:hypothetical protein